MSGRKGRIEVYLDVNSPYSLFAFTWLRRNKDALAAHGVTVDFNPIFLGGINVGSDNKPPWMHPVKAKYSPLDAGRAARYFGLQPVTAPSFFPIMSLLPMRCMLYIKRHYPEQVFISTFGELWEAQWRAHRDISKPEELDGAVLSKYFGREDVRKILAAGIDPEYKQLLANDVKRLVDGGAFGAPWMLVTDSKGKTEPFFGSDRFHYILQYLDVPFHDIEIQSPTGGKSKI